LANNRILKNIPIVDNHMHLSKDGKGIEAAKAFSKDGGTHIFLVNLPSWHHDINSVSESAYEKVFKNTLKLSTYIEDNLDIKVMPVLGVHPAELTKWIDHGLSLNQVKNIMKQGISKARQLVEDNMAVAIGEIGRPHYEVSEEVLQASNDIMRHSFGEAKSAGCPVQLHTENLSRDDVQYVVDIADDVGLSPNKIIKHFTSSPSELSACNEEKIVPSILSSKETLKSAIKNDLDFLMETDYLDDPNRPGAVLGPSTIPRRVRWMLDSNLSDKEYLQRIHKDMVEKVYNIEINY